MLSLGVPEPLALPVVGLLIFGSRRPLKPARPSRPGLLPRTRPQAGDSSEPVGLTLRQIQFRGPAPAASPPDPEGGADGCDRSGPDEPPSEFPVAGHAGAAVDDERLVHQ